MKRLYSLLLILLSTLLPTLAQNTKTVAERDTISREVTVVSDKVKQIDDTNPIFTSDEASDRALQSSYASLHERLHADPLASTYTSVV